MFPQQLLCPLTQQQGQVVPVFLLASMGAGPMVWTPSRVQQSSRLDFYRSEITCPQNHSVSQWRAQQGHGAQHQSRAEADGQGWGKGGG